MSSEYGCLDCISYYGEKRTFVAPDGHVYFCPYCGERSVIEAGDEWDEIEP